MFTKQHYIEIARILKYNCDLEDFETLLKHYFAIDNPKFSLTRFEKASKRDIPDYIQVAKVLASQQM